MMELKGSSWRSKTDALKKMLAQNQGEAIHLPRGSYTFTEQLTVNWDVTLTGEGFGENGTVLVNNTGEDYLFVFDPQYAVERQTPGLKVHFADFRIHEGGINASGAVHSSFDHIWIRNAPNIGLWLYRINASQQGHHNRVTNCTIDNATLGLLMQASDENWISVCDFEGHTTAIKDWAGNNQMIGNVFVNCTTGILMQDLGGSLIIGNNFDTVTTELDDQGSGSNIIKSNKGLADG